MAFLTQAQKDEFWQTGVFVFEDAVSPALGRSRTAQRSDPSPLAQQAAETTSYSRRPDHG